MIPVPHRHETEILEIQWTETLPTGKSLRHVALKPLDRQQQFSYRGFQKVFEQLEGRALYNALTNHGFLDNDVTDAKGVTAAHRVYDTGTDKLVNQYFCTKGMRRDPVPGYPADTAYDAVTGALTAATSFPETKTSHTLSPTELKRFEKTGDYRLPLPAKLQKLVRAPAP